MKIVPTRIVRVSLLTFLLGLGGGYLLGGRASRPAASSRDAWFDPLSLPVKYGELGPRLLSAGAISYARMAQAFRQSSRPLTAAPLRVFRVVRSSREREGGFMPTSDSLHARSP